MKRTLLIVGFVVIFLSYTTLTQAFESTPVGWVTMADGDVPYNITGGSGGSTVTVTEANAFKTYATSSSPYVILVSGTMDLTPFTSHQVSVKSNKTIIGIGYNPGIYGTLKISTAYNNVIIRNLNIWYEDASQGCSDPSNDGISSENEAHHIWIDHCNFFDSPDGLTDLTKQSNYITVSWCKYYYNPPPTGQNTCHRNCVLIGSSDTPSPTDLGKLKETFHHNWWGALCNERMPSVRFGRVHLFNNYYNCAGNDYCVRTRLYAECLVENNYFENVQNPWERYVSSVGVDHPGLLYAAGNVKVNTTSVVWTSGVVLIDGNDTITMPPYSYTMDAGADINTIVPNGAGVNKLTPSPNPMTFSVAPYALDSTSIAMTATTATCDDDGVQYLFTCTAGGGHSSSWQTSPSYTDTGLSPSTTYTYTVQTRNQTQNLFTGAASSPASATTTSGSIQRSLTTSASAGGTITTPGIGTYWYNQDTDANIVASASTGYHFVNWTGTAVTAGKVANPNAPSTTVLMDANYTAIANFAIDQKTISGHVTEPDANIPVTGVSIDATNGGGSDTTDANGYYHLTVDYGWSGTVTPSKTGYTFEPNSTVYNNVTTDQTDNYTAILDTFTISGYAVDSTLAPLADVLAAPDNNGGSYTSKYYGGGSDITDVNGYYEVLVDYNWSGNVVPSKYAYAFEPNSRAYANVTANIADQNYVGTLLTYKIVGYVKNSCEVPIKNVQVDANNGGGSDTTDVNGYYEVWVGYNWSGAVTLSKAHYTFDPNGRTYSGVVGDETGQDYVATNIYDLDCSGYIGFGDVKVIADNWLGSGPGDFNDDDNVNFLDFAEFGIIWQDR